MRQDVGPGETIELKAERSFDPDGNGLWFRWWRFAEADTYENDVVIDRSELPTARVSIPNDAAGTRLHVVLEVTDDGRPPLTSYRRFVLVVGDRGIERLLHGHVTARKKERLVL